MQSENGWMDQVAKLMTNAAGAAKGMRDEVGTMVRTQAERMANDLKLVPREEFEALKDMTLSLRRQCEALSARLDALEGGGGSAPGASGYSPLGHKTVRNSPVRRSTKSRRRRS